MAPMIQQEEIKKIQPATVQYALKILHLEDLHSDALLVEMALRKSSLHYEKLVVDTRAAFIQALEEFIPDVILSDHSLPSFNSHDALDIIHASGARIPFILITANVSEEFAVDVIKRGADDYILKDRLQRLPTAISNSVEKFRLEKERQHFLETVISNEKHYRALIENIHDAIILVDVHGEVIYQSPSTIYITGFGPEEQLHADVFEQVHPADKAGCATLFRQVAKHPGRSKTSQYRVLHKDGHYIWIEGTVTNLLADENVKSFIVTYRNITKRKQAEDALRESEFNYRQIVETAQEGIWLIDENNRTVFVNHKMCEILEYPKDEMLGKVITKFMDAAGEADMVQSLERRRNGIAENIITRYITKTGRHIWAELSANPVFDKNGNYKGGLAMVSDITEKKNLEDLLDRSNKMALIGNWEVSLPQMVLHWSAITRHIHEVEHDRIIPLDAAIEFYKEGFSRDAIKRALQEAVEHGTPWDIELQLVTAKGNERWVRVLGEAEFSNGICTKLYGSFQDIDARKKSHIEFLKACDERDIILESIGDAFFAVDKNWMVTYWNQEAEKLTGRPKKVMIGADLWDVFKDRMHTSAFENYHLAMKNNGVIHFEEYNETVDKWYEISAYPSISGLSVYFRDTTERKLTWLQLHEMNNTLQKNSKELAISNAELEQFAYVASHDLQEPLRMVTSFLTQIDKKYAPLLDEKGKQYIHFAVDGAKRMRQIILDLLEFSRIGRQQDNQEKISLNTLMKDILRMHSTQIEESSAVIICEDLPDLYAHETPLRQVFQNLLTNALKYRHPTNAPVIAINCTENKDNWQFAIKDNGIGIDEGYFDKIFIIFQRLHSREEYSGTGMGLAICKKIVENMGGQIWLESKEGQGSTFLFTILKTNKETAPQTITPYATN